MRSPDQPDACSPVRHGQRTTCGKTRFRGGRADRKHVAWQKRTAPERANATDDTRRAAFKTFRHVKTSAYREGRSTSGATRTESYAAAHRNDKGAGRICCIAIHGHIEARARDR